mgnify:CR=1 FL=1
MVAGVSGTMPFPDMMDFTDFPFSTEPYPTKIAAPVKNFDASKFIPVKQARRMARFSQLAVAAAMMAVENAGLEITPENADRVGVLLSNSVGSVAVTERDWMLIQNLASLGGIQAERKDDRDHEDDWPRANALFSTIQAHELVDPQVEAERLLFRLFHEDGVRVFDVLPLTFECRCSADRVSTVLRQYSQKELNELAESDGLIRAKCEFCSTTYSFAPDTLLRSGGPG